MTEHPGPFRPQFYLTAEKPCPYLPDRMERKLFTGLSGPDPVGLNDMLSLNGFRRSQGIAYRPACTGCAECVSVRVPVAEFRPNRTQRRVLRQNAGLLRRVCPPVAQDEHFALFSRYVATRHADGGMAQMTADDFAGMIEDTPINTRLLEYRKADGRLLGCALTDVLRDGLSMVYSFFDPDLPQQSLGVWMILDHIAIAKAAGYPHVYLGYWIAGCRAMRYKTNYAPLEMLSQGEWRRMG